MDTLEKRIRELNREILRLKTSQPLISGMKTWWAQHTFELEAIVPDPYSPQVNTSYYFEITYADGTQPILTDVGVVADTNVWLAMAVLEEPVGNKQVFVIWDTGYGSTVDLWFSSTRQIMGIRRIGPPN